ncbi:MULTISPECIES: hypothetical protein [Rhizobium]|uniref:Type II toxin-antitoxin system ParD family antitoxin n=1 Tax=Rhizobium rhododendri TaxID=2506430 RepID=A0ABY8IIZ5_9HYPH|nr:MULTISPECIES: hypothetical protein [Rhizobium]MBO9097450.1 hypothetical protein [Rhizobium sp. L58/93]MBO9133698.1 hypothetical protein [Rhizobium sp. B209b/85]MBO9167689.1 hypothetical protein [Rhizobium sp. L245/93]MBO9183648.1 hypothetical protein [Rhizobium sp. E27B/91]MBZ5761008.1 hypothetical protein [Rhizobium sp. VS19-DR96]
MNVKTEITLTEDYLRYAERLVEEGIYPSISSVVEAGIARMMLQNETSAEDPVGLTDEIRRRMALPVGDWLPWDGADMAERVKKKLSAQHNM